VGGVVVSSAMVGGWVETGGGLEMCEGVDRLL
jgi:hypothetical protein